MLVFITTSQKNENFSDYRLYHKGIILAKEQIFIKKDIIEGLITFNNIFKQYDYVFVDDCIEAFQLAILYREENLALNFIKKQWIMVFV